MKYFKIYPKNMKEFHKKLKAYEELFGKFTELRIEGNLETFDGDMAFLSHPYKVLKVRREFVECVVDGERTKLKIVEESTVDIIN